MDVKEKVGCLECGEPETAARGLCMACYQAVRRRVRAGEISWARAVMLGQCLPAKPRRRVLIMDKEKSQ